MRFLFTTLPGIAHLHAMVPVARALTTAGHKTAFATSPSFCSTVEACGFESFACGLDWLESEFMENFPELRRMHPSSAQSAEFVMDLFAGRLAAAMVADLREVAGSWKPERRRSRLARVRRMSRRRVSESPARFVRTDVLQRPTSHEGGDARSADEATEGPRSLS